MIVEYLTEQGTWDRDPDVSASRHIRPGQPNAAGRWDNVDGVHTWPVLDRVEIEAMTEDDRAAAYAAFADIAEEVRR